MRWGEWVLVVDQHPPVLRNPSCAVDIELSGELILLLDEILKARSRDLLGEPSDPLGLIDAVRCITDHLYSLEGEANLAIAAYSYAATYRPTEAELRERESCLHQRHLEQEQEEFRQRARQRAASYRHPDKR